MLMFGSLEDTKGVKETDGQKRCNNLTGLHRLSGIYRRSSGRAVLLIQTKALKRLLKGHSLDSRGHWPLSGTRESSTYP
ncbi:unnamed protein product [Prunus armeniaca]